MLDRVVQIGKFLVYSVTNAALRSFPAFKAGKSFHEEI